MIIQRNDNHYLQIAHKEARNVSNFAVIDIKKKQKKTAGIPKAVFLNY